MLFRATGFITLTVTTEFEADSLEDAKVKAVASLEEEANEMLDGACRTADINDIEVEVSE